MTEHAFDTPVGSGRFIRLLVPVVSLHLLLVFLQAVTAGLFLSGEGRAVEAHRFGATAIGLVALTQIVLAGLYWRRGGGPRWFFIASIVVLLLEVLQMGVGFTKTFWAHVPIGVGMFGGLTRQQIWVLALRKQHVAAPAAAARAAVSQT